jgi:plastocyanin
VAALALAAAIPLAVVHPFAAHASSPIVIMVDHQDAANQQPFPPHNRLFEYTDFFSRSVTVHRGDTVNFQTQPFSFHIVALARNEAEARAAYPAIKLVQGEPPAPGTGLPKIVFGDGNYPVTGGSIHGGGMIAHDHGKGPPVCGAIQFQQSPCTFGGGDDVEVIGPTVGWDLNQVPATIDQHVVIDAAPGTYTYFDMLHPGMRGTLRVVPDGAPISTQAQIDAASAVQFQQDRLAALAVENVLNHLPDPPGKPGHRRYVVAVGASAANDHVSVHAMLPKRTLNVTAGDRVDFVWIDDHALHSLGFAEDEDDLPSPFGYDCYPATPGYDPVPNILNHPTTGCLQPGKTVPVGIGDPGATPSGTPLRQGTILNAGLLVGKAYGAQPTAQKWSVTVDANTAPGDYHYWCPVHDWMTGTLRVS